MKERKKNGEREDVEMGGPGQTMLAILLVLGQRILYTLYCIACT